VTAKKNKRLITLAFLSLPLAACTLPRNGDEDNIVQEQSLTAIVEAPVSNRYGQNLVVESLIYEASGFRTRPFIPYRTDIDLDGDGVEDEQIEPVEPSIPMTANRVVELAINDFLQNRRGQLRSWLTRAYTYFPMIEQIFEEEGIPDELKYLALSESGLQPTIKSPMGAAGMWQFMPITARGSGLTVDDWVDERMDPEKSTRAAARHLIELNQSYSGNWHLALAGYNCSYRCISRAVIRAGGTIENPPSFWEVYPYLPRETRDFIPKFIATALILSNPAMYGIDPEVIGQEMAYDVVKVEGMLSLQDAATLAGTNVATLVNLNPSLQKRSLPDWDQAFELKIPFGSYDRFVRNFDSTPASERTAPVEYVVKSGDTLGAIARRFGTSVDELQKSNGFTGSMIRINQKLLIPGTGSHKAVNIASDQRIAIAYGEPKFRPIMLREEFQVVEQDGSTEDKPLLAVSLTSPPPPEDRVSVVVPTIYKVQSGDTLGQIAERFRVSVADIQRWNSINGTLIRAGQDLTLHAGATQPAPGTIYRVQRGDSLDIIARRFGVSVDNIKRWNNLSSNLIHPGQDLQIN
jgi:membrane-bound lytic murein transglycosylase D